MSGKGVVFRFVLGLLAGLAASLLVVGCAVDRRTSLVLGAGQERGTWATPAELSWLTKLGRWERSLMSGLRAASPQRSTLTCRADLLGKVGPPPTARLERAFATFRRACAQLEERDPARAGALILVADQMLPPGEVRQLPVIAGPAGASRVEPRFGRVASVLARKAVDVRCWSTADWRKLIQEERVYTSGQLGRDTLGFAGIHGNRINLAPDICDSLVDLAYEGARPTDEPGRLLLAAAVVTLSHEAQHSRGISVEAVAECYAIQVAQRTAVKLGAHLAYARSLVRSYWLHYDEEPAAYRSGECRRGGSLDLGYADSIWR